MEDPGVGKYETGRFFFSHVIILLASPLKGKEGGGEGKDKDKKSELECQHVAHIAEKGESQVKKNL